MLWERRFLKFRFPSWPAPYRYLSPSGTRKVETTAVSLVRAGCTKYLPSFANLIPIEARCAAAVEPPAHPHKRLSLKRDLVADDVSFTYSDGQLPAVSH